MRRETLILGFLDAQIFNPVLSSRGVPADVRRGVRFTRMCVARLPAKSMVRYFWSAIEGTGYSEDFSERMRATGFTTFEDVSEEARQFFRSLNL